MFQYICFFTKMRGILYTQSTNILCPKSTAAFCPNRKIKRTPYPLNLWSGKRFSKRRQKHLMNVKSGEVSSETSLSQLSASTCSTSLLHRTYTHFTLHCCRIRVRLGIPQITQARPWVSHRAAWARIFSTICDSANPTSRGVDLESDNTRDSSEKEVGWFVLSLAQPFLYLFDGKTTTVEQISVFKLICSKNDGLIYLIVLPVG